MTIIRNILICTILTIISSKSYAEVIIDNDNSDYDLLSIPSEPFDPFSEVSWYIKHAYGNIEIPLIQDIPESNINGTFFFSSAGLNKPVYDNLLSYGANITLTLSHLDKEVMYNKISELSGKNFIQKESDDMFLTSSLDSALHLKGSFPISDNIALTAQGDAGMSLLFVDLRNSIMETEENKISGLKAFRPGFVGALSLGVEFFPIEWVGISVNWNCRHYHYLGVTLDAFEKFKDNKDFEQDMHGLPDIYRESEEKRRKEKEEVIRKSQEAYSISVNNIFSFAIHFTF